MFAPKQGRPNMHWRIEGESNLKRRNILPKQFGCKGTASGLYTESVVGNNYNYLRCNTSSFFEAGPGAAGYYPGSDPEPWRGDCWNGIAREEPIPGKEVGGTFVNLPRSDAT